MIVVYSVTEFIRHANFILYILSSFHTPTRNQPLRLRTI